MTLKCLLVHLLLPQCMQHVDTIEGIPTMHYLPMLLQRINVYVGLCTVLPLYVDYIIVYFCTYHYMCMLYLKWPISPMGWAILQHIMY